MLLSLFSLAVLGKPSVETYGAPVVEQPHYLVLYFSGGIERYTLGGTYIDTFIPGGGGRMTLDSDGRLYVSNYSLDAVYRYDAATGESLGIFASAGLQGAIGLDFGPNGNLYVASANNNQVVEFDGATGQFIRGIAVQTPIDVEFGPDQNLYVARGHHQISASGVDQFDGFTGEFLKTFATSPVFTPTALAFGPGGDLFVSNQISPTNQDVVRFSGQTGEFLQTVVSDGIDNPQSMLFRPDGSMLLGTSGNRTIRRYDVATGAFLGNFVTHPFNSTADILFMRGVPEPNELLLAAISLGAMMAIRRDRPRYA